jgi:hypothetical protein
MTDKNTPTVFEAGEVTSIHREENKPKQGQWFWVKNDEGAEWFGCVTREMSNAVEVKSPRKQGYGQQAIRVHLDEVSTLLRFEPNASQVIRERINHYKSELDTALARIEQEKAAIGIGHSPQANGPVQEASTAVAVISSQTNIEGYKSALQAFKDRQPLQKKEIEELMADWGKWMSAESLPLEGLQEQMKATLGAVDDRLFNINLYAGFSESTVQFSEGQPATLDDKLHLMQRRLYMDEECLLGYAEGGMDIKNMAGFRTWLAKPVNRDRILPFPRCIVSMQIRRKIKHRDWKGCLVLLHENAHYAESDKYTYLIIRNGENLYQLTCDLDFGELIFPEKAMFEASEPTMVKMRNDTVEEMITKRDFDDRVRLRAEQKKKREQWFIDNPEVEWRAKNKGSWDFANPISVDYWPASDWHPFDQSSVYYDEAIKDIADRIKQYNRIAMIIQGLFDRKDILEPVKPMQSWNPASFASAVELVYDGFALLHGDTPDFEAYRASCNAKITVNSVLVGQDDFWQRDEARQEIEYHEKRRRSSSEQIHRPTHTKPWGDPGPGFIAVPERVSRKKALFSWLRCARRGDGITPRSITVPFENLFNISAYSPGDYLQFFRDPRTRAQYLEWAPLLIAAEDFYAGKLTPQHPGFYDPELC